MFFKHSDNILFLSVEENAHRAVYAKCKELSSEWTVIFLSSAEMISLEIDKTIFSSFHVIKILWYFIGEFILEHQKKPKSLYG